jgi:(S)-ureidoglycine aminohydrolase
MTKMSPVLGLTRNVIRPRYALITPDGVVPSVWPGWSGCTPYVLISAAMGARFSQYLVMLDGTSRASGETENEEWFLYSVAGKVNVRAADRGRIYRQSLHHGGYALLPPGMRYDIEGAAEESRLLIFRKRYEALAGHDPPTFVARHEQDVAEAPFLGDPHARLKVLLDDGPAADMAVNIFTYDPGATLPFVETHVMEHGMLFLDGGGMYRLDNDWHPVTAGDALWIAPYCPQWFIAAGPGPARYIYYKDVNRLPA